MCQSCSALSFTVLTGCIVYQLAIPGYKAPLQGDGSRVDAHKDGQEAGASDCTAHSVCCSAHGALKCSLQVEDLHETVPCVLHHMTVVLYRGLILAS